MAVIGSLSVKLGLVTVEWDKATSQAKQQAKALQKSFEELTGGVKKLQEGWKALGGAVSASSIGFAALMQQTAAFTDEIVDMSKGFGLSVQQTLAFKDALISAGSTAESANKGMSALFAKIEEARQGNDPVLAQFEQLGITFEELKTMSPYEAIQKVANGLAGVGNEFERVKLMKDFFGRAGIGLSMEELSKALATGTERFDKYAASIERFGLLHDNIQKSMNNLKIAFADLAAPFIRDLVIGPEKFATILKSIVAVGVIAGLAKVVEFMVALSAAIKEATIAATVFNMTAGGATPIGMILKGAALGVAAVPFLLPQAPKLAVSENLMSAQLDRDKQIEDSEREQEKLLSKQAQVRAAQVDLLQKMNALSAQRNALQEQSVYGETAALQLAKSNLTLQEQLTQIESKRQTKLAELGDQATTALKDQINLEAKLEAKRAQADAASRAREIRKRAEYEDLKNRLLSYGNIGADIEQEGMTPQARRDAEEARARTILDLRNAMRESARLADLSNERLKYEMQIADLLPRQQEILLAEYDLAKQIDEYRKKAAERGETQAAIEATVKEMKEAGYEAIRLKELSQEQQRSFEYGWNKAFNAYLDNASNAAKTAEQLFTSVTDHMTSAIEQFVSTGKLSFKDLARSIIQDLIKIQLRAQTSGIFQMVGRALFGNPIGASGYSDMGTFNALMAAGGLAEGGPIGANEPHLVGERGPELFMPKTSGTIIPNHQLANMGGVTNVTNNYINAIDTKSFEQRLLGSSKAIWAANSYAQKSLSVSPGRM